MNENTGSYILYVMYKIYNKKEIKHINSIKLYYTWNIDFKGCEEVL